MTRPRHCAHDVALICQANNAATVKIILSLRCETFFYPNRLIWYLSSKDLYLSDSSRVDLSSNGKIRRTQEYTHVEADAQQIILANSQSNTQPQRRSYRRYFVSIAAIFRPLRSFASQIRDAAPSSNRRLVGQPGGSGIWRLETDVLPGATGVRTTRPEGLIARQTWPQKRAQVDRHNDRTFAALAARRSNTRCPSAIQASTSTLPAVSAPTQYRTCATTSVPKKVDHSSVAADGSQIIDAYERLRSAALGKEAARASGWTVFLRRGMWAWIEVSQSLYSAPIPRCACCRASAPAADAQVVHVLAQMVLAVEAMHDEL